MINALAAIVPSKPILINKLEVHVTALKGFTQIKINAGFVTRIAFDALTHTRVSNASKAIILLMDNAFIQNIRQRPPGSAIKSPS